MLTAIITPIRHNIMTTCLMLCWSPFAAKAAWPVEASTRPLKVCWHQHISPVNWEVGPLWIGLVCPAHLTDARLDWDLENLEAKSTPQTRGCAPQTIPEPFLLCSTVHCPADRGHSNQGILFPWKGAHGLQQCLANANISHPLTGAMMRR